MVPPAMQQVLVEVLGPQEKQLPSSSSYVAGETTEANVLSGSRLHGLVKGGSTEEPVFEMRSQTQGKKPAQRELGGSGLGSSGSEDGSTLSK